MKVVNIILPNCPLFNRSVEIVVGVLKGYDQLVNLVLDETKEYLRGKII